MSLPTTCSPLRQAAPTMMAVPCWSSWNTGIFMRRRNSRSTMKHSGALMSSRLMAPKVGSRAAMSSTSFSGSRCSTSMSNTSMPANFLNSTALPSITGLAASGPDGPQPQHRRAVGDDADQVAARGEAKDIERILDDGLAGGGDAGRIGQRQVALIEQLLGGRDRQFPGSRKLVIVQRRLLAGFLDLLDAMICGQFLSSGVRGAAGMPPLGKR